MSKLRLRIFGGTRQLFPLPAQLLVTIMDGNQQQHVRRSYSNPDLLFNNLPFFDNFGDNYSLLVWCDGYQQAGFVPDKLSNAYTFTLDIMLIPKEPQFNFATGLGPAAKAAYPFLASGAANDDDAQQRYDNLMEENAGKPLACMLNLCEAMSQINLSQGAEPPAQNRFFAWCDPALIDQVKIAAAKGLFAVEVDPGLLHAGATASWKQVQFGEANVQLTFHQGNTNALTHSLTDPAQVYVLRWIDGQTSGIPEFDPLYVIR